jgi:hypothetical protein
MTGEISVYSGVFEEETRHDPRILASPCVDHRQHRSDMPESHFWAGFTIMLRRASDAPNGGDAR